MRLAILSDTHGNLIALDAVLQHIRTRTPFDHIIVAGDLAWGGPRPRETIDRLIEVGALGVMGNMDAYMLGAKSPIPTREDFFPADHPIAVWMNNQLGDAEWDYLLNLPFARRFEPDSHGRLLIVHANPSNLDDTIYADTADEIVRPMIQGADADVIAYGHIHINSQRRIDNILLVNVSSAGIPTDGDTRAAWDEFEWDEQEQRWKITVHRVAYDIEATVHDLNTCGRPYPEKWIKRLRTAVY